MKANSALPTPKILPSYLSSRLVVYIRNYRVLDWRAYVGMATFGFAQGLGVFVAQDSIHVFLRFMATVFLYLAFSFSINNCFDAGCDALREEKLAKNPLAAGLVGFREGLALSLCAAIAGLSLVYLWFGGCLLTYLSLTLLAGAYSMPPLRLKSVPLVDLVSHGLFFGALLYLYGYGASASGGLGPEAVLMGASTFIYSTTLELRNHLDDLQTDISSGERTTACWLGHRRSVGLLKTLLLFHWMFLAGVSFAVRASFVVPFIAIAALIGSKRLKLSRYLRLADACTCAVYLAFLLENSTWLSVRGM